MKIFIRFLLFSALLMASIQNQTKAQSIELVGGNILNGALTGSILGVATMGLNDTSDFTAFRVGLGSGILFGTGIAFYDLATVPRGQRFFISGFLNDGKNTSILILLDTLYGSAVGVAVGSAVALIGNHALTDGIQYGAGTGAWVGFGVGLIDAFVLAERNSDFISSPLLNKDSLLSLNRSNSTMKFLQPDMIRYNDLSGSTLGARLEPTLNIISYHLKF
ncbi:MAG: hypothetical protein WD513_03105 [Balneolaceae bacterium]